MELMIKIKTNFLIPLWKKLKRFKFKMIHKIKSQKIKKKKISIKILTSKNKHFQLKMRLLKKNHSWHQIIKVLMIFLTK